MLVLIKILTWMVSPSGFFLWGLLVAGLIRWLQWKKSGAALAIAAIGQLIVFSAPPTADALLLNLENRARLLESQEKRAERILASQGYGAIVILGGAIDSAYPPNRLYPDLNDAADRIWHGARLYKQALAPKIIASGGRFPGREGRDDIATEAKAMRMLLLDLGVPDSAIVLEEKSRTTRENAEFTRSLAGDRPIALVTSASHMPRALAIFRKAGMDVDAYPTDFRVIPEIRASWERWLPSGANLQRSETAIKEYLALAIGY